MSASQFIFYAISAFILGAAMLAVTSRKIFRSAIWLLSTLVGIAGLYFWMQVEFIAAVQIIVYVGGIVVLIIFSIFLTQESGKELPKTSWKKMLFSALAVLAGFGLTYNLVYNHGFGETTKPFVVSMNAIGTQMLSLDDHGYILPFEVVSMLLLAAMIGCIVIAMKPKDQKPKGEKTGPLNSGLESQLSDLNSGSESLLSDLNSGSKSQLSDLIAQSEPRDLNSESIRSSHVNNENPVPAPLTIRKFNHE